MLTGTGGPAVVARGNGVLGELVLRRRPGPVFELIINGVFLMDTADTSTERLLAEVVGERHPAPRRVLLGGLGLGCTLAALLDNPQVARVDVTEIEPVLVSWLRDGRVPGVASLLSDHRVDVHVDDVRELLARSPARYDAVVLDVDNGPAFLVHERNAGLYQRPALADAARALRPGGVLVIWSAAPAPELRQVLEHTVGPTSQVHRRVRREGRDLDYYLYVSSTRPASGG